MSIARRVYASLAAGAFGQAVTVVTQLLLTPVYFRLWGAERYGEWLMLASIPAYLAMADLGIGPAAANEMTMLAGAGQRSAAQRTFRGALWLAVLAGALSVLAGGVAGALCLWGGLPGLQHIAPAEAAGVLVGLAATVGLGFTAGVLFGGFRCGDHNALGLAAGNAARLADALAMSGALLLGGGPLSVCGAALASRVLTLAAQALLLRRSCPWLFTPRETADLGVARRLLRPALGFLVFPLSNALALQGPLLLIGALLGPAAVAMFSALRTLARVPVQLTTMLNAAVWPEMSRAFGADDLALLRRLHRAAWGGTLLMVGPMIVLLALMGPVIARGWLGPAAPYDGAVFAALLLATAVSTVWGASFVVLAAINRHLRLSLGFLGVNAAALGAAWLAGRGLGWPGILAPLVLAEAVLVGLVLPRVLAASEDGVPGFLRGVWREGGQGGWRRLRSHLLKRHRATPGTAGRSRPGRSRLRRPPPR